MSDYGQRSGRGEEISGNAGSAVGYAGRDPWAYASHIYFSPPLPPRHCDCFRSLAYIYPSSPRSGYVIFADDTTQDRRTRIYHAALASKATSEMHGGMSKPDNVTKTAMSIMESRYKVTKRDSWSVPIFSEKPKDWMLCTPEDIVTRRDRFHIFAVKGSKSADDWLDNFDGGDDVSTITLLRVACRRTAHS